MVSLDRFSAKTGDARLRSPPPIEESLVDGSPPRLPTVGQLADVQPLLALAAAPFPATVGETDGVDYQARVPFG